MSSVTSSGRFPIHAELLCKSGCGFYGNPAWQGYCSKCYRQRTTAVLPQASTNTWSPQDVAKIARTRLSRTASESAATLSFSKFQERRRQHLDNYKVKNKTVRNIFRKGTAARDAAFSGVWREHRQPSFESKQVAHDFAQFLQTLQEPASQDLSRHIHSVIDQATKACDRDAPIDDIADIVHHFYQTMARRIRNHPAFQDATSEKMEQILDFTEKFVMTQLYKYVFCPSSTDDEDKDIDIQTRIRQLHWVSARHLDTPINELNADVRDLLDKAVTAIIEMDSKRAPQDKLNCIVRCSQHIFSALGLSQLTFAALRSQVFALQPKRPTPESADVENPDDAKENAPPTDAENDGTRTKEEKETSVEETPIETSETPVGTSAVSADDFLPALIYVVLRANPPLLHSNINYVTRFCSPGRLSSGEGGYYFTNLCCAVKYIEDLDAESLGLPEAEFDGYMRGDAVPPGYHHYTSATFPGGPSEGTRLLQQNIDSLKELTERQQRLHDAAITLQSNMASFKLQLTEAIDQVLEQNPWTIRPRKAPTDIDSENIDTNSLPTPLEPQVVNPVSKSEDTVTDTGIIPFPNLVPTVAHYRQPSCNSATSTIHQIPVVEAGIGSNIPLESNSPYYYPRIAQIPSRCTPISLIIEPPTVHRSWDPLSPNFDNENLIAQLPSPMQPERLTQNYSSNVNNNTN